MVHSSDPPTDAPEPRGRLDDRDRQVLAAIDEDEALELLCGLIAQPSENPPGAEGDCARFLMSFLEARGVACRPRRGGTWQAQSLCRHR